MSKLETDETACEDPRRMWETPRISRIEAADAEISSGIGDENDVFLS